VELTSWSTPATDWTRFLGDVRGVTNVARHVLPEVRPRLNTKRVAVE
jgi:hypothetical protein